MTLRPAYEMCRRHQMTWLAVLVVILTGRAGAWAQDPTGTALSGMPAAGQNPSESSSGQQAKTTSEPNTELSSKDTDTTFKLRVNLVQVKVVVRDAKANLVRDLKREDFQVYDQGKLQTITTFGVETPGNTQKKDGRSGKDAARCE